MSFNEEETKLIQEVKALFERKPRFGKGANFRKEFIHAAMDGFCINCGDYTVYKTDYCCMCREIRQ